MIIDPTDFLYRPYKVPNQEEARDFTNFIEKAEEEIAIKCLLGKPLWDAFKDQKESTDPQWVALRDGSSYVYGEKTYSYGGWVDMIRPAIYSMWLPQSYNKLTNIGYIVNNAPQQSALIEDQYPFVVTFWNEFCVKVGSDYYNRYFGTFYGFMNNNDYEDTSYVDWSFNCPKPKNRFDI